MGRLGLLLAALPAASAFVGPGARVSAGTEGPRGRHGVAAREPPATPAGCGPPGGLAVGGLVVGALAGLAASLRSAGQPPGQRVGGVARRLFEGAGEKGERKIARDPRAGTSFKAQALGGTFLFAATLFLFGYPIVVGGISLEYLIFLTVSAFVVIGINAYILSVNDDFEERNFLTIIDEAFFMDEKVWRPFEGQGDWQFERKKEKEGFKLPWQ